MSQHLTVNKKVFVLRDMGAGDMICTFGMLEYLSTLYEEVLTNCIEHSVNLFVALHKDNSKIKYLVYKKEYMANGWNFPAQILQELSLTHDIIKIGHYYGTYLDNPIKIYDYPDSYYDDCGIPRSYSKSYLKFSIPNDLQKIYNNLFASKSPYIVVHQESSSCHPDIVRKQHINVDKQLVIDVNKNLYHKDHCFYEIANKFVNLVNPLWYAPLIMNANELYVTDSMLYSLSICLDITNVKRKICYNRSDNNFLGFKSGYEYIKLVYKRDMEGHFRFSYPDEQFYLLNDPHIQ